MTKVKICGLTSFDDARVAAEAGADSLGFIFYGPSPRYVTPEAVREIVTRLKETGDGRQETGEGHSSLATRHSPLFIGVFVNEALESVQRILDFCGLDAAQLHGDEPPEMVAALAGRAYKALRPPSRGAGEAMVAAYLPCSPAPALPCLLLDAYHPTLYGGTGRVTDWSLAAAVAARHDILLAGSLTPENVAEAVATVRPWGVDVSSGVEAEKGRKDWGKVRAFIENVKSCH
ncbi:MAG: phosphoribosylanthranilate isomerase [Anaerolineae bacterium]